MKRALKEILTNEFCYAVKYSEGQRNEYRDGGNLEFTVTRSGEKRWRVIAQKNGVVYKVIVGNFPAISLADARSICRNIVRDYISRGVAPHGYACTVGGVPHCADVTENVAEELGEDVKASLTKLRDTPLGSSKGELISLYGSAAEAAAYRVEEFKDITSLNRVARFFGLSDGVLYGLSNGTYPPETAQGNMNLRTLQKLGVLPMPAPASVEEPEPEADMADINADPIMVAKFYQSESIPAATPGPMPALPSVVALLNAIAEMHKDSPATIVLVNLIKGYLA